MTALCKLQQWINQFVLLSALKMKKNLTEFFEVMFGRQVYSLHTMHFHPGSFPSKLNISDTQVCRRSTMIKPAELKLWFHIWNRQWRSRRAKLMDKWGKLGKIIGEQEWEAMRKESSHTHPRLRVRQHLWEQRIGISNNVSLTRDVYVDY